MALADRTLRPTTPVTKLDQLLATLPPDDAAWLQEHLTARDARGGYLYSARRLSAEMTDEGPVTAIGKSAIDEWRQRNGK